MVSVILDCNIWIKGLLGIDPFCTKILDQLLSGKMHVIISSYGVAEVIAVLRRLRNDPESPQVDLEKYFWSILYLPTYYSTRF